MPHIYIYIYVYTCLNLYVDIDIDLDLGIDTAMEYRYTDEDIVVEVDIDTLYPKSATQAAVGELVRQGCDNLLDRRAGREPAAEDPRAAPPKNPRFCRNSVQGCYKGFDEGFR